MLGQERKNLHSQSVIQAVRHTGRVMLCVLPKHFASQNTEKEGRKSHFDSWCLEMVDGVSFAIPVTHTKAPLFYPHSFVARFLSERFSKCCWCCYFWMHWLITVSFTPFCRHWISATFGHTGKGKEEIHNGFYRNRRTL